MKDLLTNGIIPADKLSNWQVWTLGELVPPLKSLPPADMAKLLAVASPTAVASGTDVNFGAQSDIAPAATEANNSALGNRFDGYPTAAELEAMHQDAWQAGYDAGLLAGRVVGYEEGRAVGLVAGKEEAREVFAESWTSLTSLAQAFRTSLERIEDGLATDILKLSIVLAERLVADHLVCDHNIIVPILREVLAELPTTLPQGRLRVHPDDLAMARVFLEQETPETVWQWVEEPTIERGGCILETPQLRLDLTLATRLAALKAALGTEPGHAIE